MSEYVVNIIIEDYKGFSIRESRKGYLAFKVHGQTLPTCETVEKAVASVDQHLEWERRRVELERQQREAREQREREEAERQRLHTEAVLACIQPIRDFVAVHGLSMLDACLQQLNQEKRERNVPANWEELVTIAEKIGEQRSGPNHGWETQVGEVDVDKYGVTEHTHYNSREDEYMRTIEYGLQDYIDEFRESYLGEEEEEA